MRMSLAFPWHHFMKMERSRMLALSNEKKREMKCNTRQVVVYIYMKTKTQDK